MSRLWQLWIAGNDPDLVAALESRAKIAATGCTCHINAPMPMGGLVERLNALPAEDLRNSLVIVDVGAVEDAFYVNTMGIAIELLLSFPEVAWVFSGTQPAPATDVGSLRDLLATVYIAEAAGLPELSRRLGRHEMGLRPLFDPYGLRQVVKQAARQIDAERFREAPAPAVGELRPGQRAVTIDEEPEFAYLAGYVAYCAGHPCHAITTLRAMHEILGSGSPEKFELAIDDIQLSFADDVPATRRLFGELSSEENVSLDIALGHSSVPSSILEARDRRWFPGLGEASLRLHLTRLHGGDLETVEKPFPGIHFLRERIDRLERERSGTAEGQGPAPHLELSAVTKTSAVAISRHAAPAALQVTIQRLLERCRRIKRDGAGQGCEHFAHGALLAFEAGKLLNRTAQTTGFEILELRHCLEVQAECMFHGVSAPVCIDRRLEEVGAEILSNLGLDGPPTEPWQHKQYWSAYLRILHQLKSIFAAFGQFEEESRCLRELRRAIRNDRYWEVRTRVRDRQEGGENRWRRLLNPPLAWLRRAGSWYFAAGVGSVRSAVLLLLFWTLVFGLWLHALDPKGHDLFFALGSSAISLISVAPVLICGCTLTDSGQVAVVLLLEMIVAYIHLGLLISLAYQWVSRR